MPTPTEISAKPQDLPQPTVEGHEKSDMAVKWVFGFFLLLFVGGIAIQFIISKQLRDLQAGPAPTDQWWASRRAARTAEIAPRNFPRLQVSAPADLEAFRAREEAELNSYGWVNQTAGVVRIPISRAMELLLAKGLPTRTGTNGSKMGPSSLELQQQRALQAEPERGRR